jgi:hypothetical protein
MEFEHLDARLGGIEYTFMLVGASHFALQAAGAFFRIDVKRFEHGPELLFVARNSVIYCAPKPRGAR